jgi:hypothetical protein
VAPGEQFECAAAISLGAVVAARRRHCHAKEPSDL